MSPRIFILSAEETPTLIMDNDAPESLHYYDDTLHTYLSAGGAGMFTFTVDSTHPDSRLIEPGMKVSFRFEDSDWYFSIVRVERDEDETVVTGEGLSFEFLNEEIDKYEASREMTFAEYLTIWGFEREILTIQRDETNGQKKKLKFDQRETVLKRLSRLADEFNAEIRFVPSLTRNGALANVYVHVCLKGDKRGIGHDRTQQIVRWGYGPESIRKTVDLTDFCSGIRARGKTSEQSSETKTVKRWVRNSDQVTVKTEETVQRVVQLPEGKQTVRTVTTTSGTYRKKTQDTTLVKTDGTEEKKNEVLEDHGNEIKFKDTEVTVVTDPKVETKQQSTVTLSGCTKEASENGYSFKVIGDDLRCPEARDRYPSALTKNPDGSYADGYVIRFLEDTQCETQEDLFEKALAELKKRVLPKVSYEVSGVAQGSAGDWLTVEDAGYSPVAYYQCRIVEKEVCVSTGEVTIVKLDNFTEVSSKLSSSLSAQIQAELDRITTYDCRIVSAHSTVMDDDGTAHVFSAVVRKGAVDVTDQTMISWTLGEAAVPENDSRITTPGQITLYPEDISAGATELKFTATQNGIYRGEGAVTLSASPYICRISAPQGTIMDDDSPHTFTASVQKGSVNVTPTMTFTWTLDGEAVGSGTSVSIEPENVPFGSSALVVTAKSKNAIRVTADLTLSRTLITVQEGEDGATITINEHSAFITKGEPGVDGFSPVVSLSKSGKTSTLKVTDKNGVHTSTINDGEDGKPGAAAPVISSIRTMYKATSSSTPPTTTGDFSSTLPTLSATTRYLWAYDVFMFSDRTERESAVYLKTVHGATGSAGARGVGISSITTKYYQSSSSAAPSQSSSSWGTTIPSTLTAGYYLHTQIAITLTNGTTSYYYQKTRNGSDGSSNNLVIDLGSYCVTPGAGTIHDTDLAQRVTNAVRSGVMPLIYYSNAYYSCKKVMADYTCGSYYITIKYDYDSCGGFYTQTLTITS